LNKSQHAICSALLAKGPSTRREICAVSDLSWAAISQSASQLLDMKLIAEGHNDDSPRKKGRPSSQLFLHASLACAGVSINRDGIDTELWFPSSGLRARSERNYDVQEDPVPTAIESLRQLLAENPDANVVCLGISFPGLIDTDRKNVISSVHFHEFLERPIAMEFEEALGLDVPVFVERNAVCDMADIVVREGAREDMLLLSLHSGVSAAVLVDGQILYGNSGNIGELGHLNHPDSDIPCACGRVGCMETLVGWLAWERGYKRLRREDKSLPSTFNEAVALGAPEAVALLRESLHALFPLLGNLCVLLKPGKVMFATNLSSATATVFSTVVGRRLEKALSQHSPKVELLSEYSSVDGAAALGALWLSGHPHYLI